MTRTQTTILLLALPALALIAAAFAAVGGGLVTLPAGWGADRARLAAACAALPGAMLMWAILDVSLTRFTSPADIDGAGLTEPTPPIKLRRAILANTLEQAVLAAIGYFAFAMLAPGRWLAVLPLLAGLFVVGRVLFRFGYRRGAAGRTLGFVLTFTPTMVVYLMLIGFAFGLE